VEDLAAFARLVTALRPWLGDLVLVGGWAHRLHRFHPLAKPPAHQPLRTRDADLAFAGDAVLRGSMRAALRNAGFREELLGEDAPPAVHYRLGDEDAGFYAEFLTPLRGAGLKSDGTSDATVSKAGITAQKLRYVDLLLVSPWDVKVGPGMCVPIRAEAIVRVPNPVSFIIQRMLIHSERSVLKKAQDVLYIHDTLELFGASLDELQRLWVEAVRPAMPARTARRAIATATAVFETVTDVIREAARIPQDRRPEPEHIRMACQYGLGEILKSH
jgi:hypothetical protein